jgi:hypothetical protein
MYYSEENSLPVSRQPDYTYECSSIGDDALPVLQRSGDTSASAEAQAWTTATGIEVPASFTAVPAVSVAALVTPARQIVQAGAHSESLRGPEVPSQNRNGIGSFDSQVGASSGSNTVSVPYTLSHFRDSINTGSSREAVLVLSAASFTSSSLRLGRRHMLASEATDQLQTIEQFSPAHFALMCLYVMFWPLAHPFLYAWSLFSNRAGSSAMLYHGAGKGVWVLARTFSLVSVCGIVLYCIGRVQPTTIISISLLLDYELIHTLLRWIAISSGHALTFANVWPIRSQWAVKFSVPKHIDDVLMQLPESSLLRLWIDILGAPAAYIRASDPWGLISINSSTRHWFGYGMVVWLK